MDFKDKNFSKIIAKEIMALDSLPVLAGTVATLHAASTVSSIEDYRYALRCKEAGIQINVRTPKASNSNKKGKADMAEQRLKLAIRGGLRARLHLV